MTVLELEAEGYINICHMNGKCYGIYRFMFTTGLVVGIDDAGYESRYCYSQHYNAVEALKDWDGIGDPPGNWIKQKGSGIDRANPNKGYYKPTIEDFYDGMEYEGRDGNHVPDYYLSYSGGRYEPVTESVYNSIKKNGKVWVDNLTDEIPTTKKRFITFEIDDEDESLTDHELLKKYFEQYEDTK